MKIVNVNKTPKDLNDIHPGKYVIRNKEYHSLSHILSSSGARRILKNPARFKYEQTAPPPESKVFEEGTIWHSYMLEKGIGLEYVDADNWLTQAAKEARAEIKTRGLVPVLAKDKETLAAAKESLMQNPDTAILMENGMPELSYITLDEKTGRMLRTRPDWLNTTNNRFYCVDYKTTTDASKDAFELSAAKYGYHLQAAWYVTELEKIYGERPEFYFIAQEKTPPYLTAVYQLPDIALEYGANQNRAAIDAWAEYEAMGYPKFYKPAYLDLPYWDFSKE